MRKYSKSWISSIFLGLLGLSFGVWGIADIFKGTTDTNVATIGSTTISSDEFQREYTNALKNQTGPDGKPITSEEARKAGMPAALLQSLINRAALDNAAGRLGLSASDAQAAAEIRAARGFAGPLGGFDHDTFMRAIISRGYTEQQFINLVRGDIVREELVAAGGAGFALPASYAQALFSFLNEVRAADYVIIPASAVGEIPPPSDAVLQSFVKDNASQFSTPEYREVDFAQITPEDLAGQIQVTDTQLKQQYELRLDDPRFGYNVPEKRDVEQIVFPNEAAATAAKAKIDGGTSFADVAKANGGAPVSLGSVAKDDLGTRGAATFALADNGVTAPQKNLTGWVLLHVTKITPGIHKTLDDVKEDIRKDVATQLAASKISDMSNAYVDASSSGLTVAEAGKKVGMHTGHIAAVDANGLAPDGSKTPAADNPDFLKQIFAAEVGDDGDPFSTRSGALYVLKVNGQVPPKLKSLDVVRVQATAAWTAQQRAKLLAAKADALAAAATKDKNLSAAIAVAGTPAVNSGLLHRPLGPDQSENPALPATFVAKLFLTPPGEAVAGPSATGNSYIVARISGVGHPAISTDSLQFMQGASQLNHQAAQDFEPAMANAARNKQGVTINQANADRVTGEGT
ncbi:MAG TPA: SurA N-terminal domain-containing protein [Rhizomicrobium sp.]